MIPAPWPVACRPWHSLGLMVLAHACAALAEIAGCFAFWGWLCLDRSAWWLAVGMLSLSAPSVDVYVTASIKGNGGGSCQRGTPFGTAVIPGQIALHGSAIPVLHQRMR